MTEQSISPASPSLIAGAKPSRWLLLGALTLVQTGLSGLQFSLVALLPVIKSELGLSVTRTVVLTSAISAGALVAAIPAGQVTNRLGERRTLTGGAVMAGLAIVVAALLSNTWLMLAPLIVAGLGVVTSHPAGIRLIMRHFSVRERGGAISLRQTAVPLGGALAALALPPLATVAGWRGAMIAVGVLALALAVLAWVVVPEREPEEGSAAAQAAGGFRRVLRTPGVAVGVALSMVLNIGQVAVVTFIALYVHFGLGRSVFVGALLLALVQGSGIAGRILWGVLSDRAFAGRRRPLLIWLGAASALTLGTLALVGSGTPVWLLALLALVAGLTAVAWNGLAIALTTEAAGLGGAATAMSFIVMVVSFVNAAVPVAGGWLVDTTGSYRPLWLAVAVVLLLSPLLTLLTPERSDRSGG